MVDGEAVLEAVRAARVLGDVAADRAHLLRRRIGRVVEAVGGDRARDVEVRDAGLDDDLACVEVDRRGCGRAAPARSRSRPRPAARPPERPVPGAARDERDAGVVAGAHDRLHLGRRAPAARRARGHAPAGQPVALVGAQLLGLADHLGRRRETRDELARSPIASTYTVGSSRWTSALFCARRASRGRPERSARLREALPGRRSVPRRDPLDRGAALPRSRARDGRAARRARPSRVAGLGRLHADRRGARRDGATAAAAKVEVSLFARPNAAWVLSATARAHGGFAATAHGQGGSSRTWRTASARRSTASARC